MRWIIAVLTTIVALNSYAQQFRVLTYAISDDVNSQAVNSVVQDSIGFIWLGTNAGLYRFNGKDFSLHNQGLEGGVVRDFLKMQKGALYFSGDGGLYQLWSRPDTALVKQILGGHIESTDSTLYYPNRLYEDVRGNVWISEPQAAVVRYHKGRMKRYFFDGALATGASDSHFSFAEDQAGNLWMAAPTGELFQYDGDTDSFSPMKFGTGPSQITDMMFLETNELIVVGDGIWVFLIDEGRIVTTSRSLVDLPLPIQCVVQSTNGQFYFGTEQGIYRTTSPYDFVNLERVFSHNDPHRVEDLPLQQINRLFFMDKRHAWICADDGLGLLQANFFEAQGGLPMQHIYAITAPVPNKVYVSFGELFELTLGRQRTATRQLLGSRSGFILSVAQQADRILASNVDGELLSLQEGRIRRTLNFADRGGAIFYMLTDHHGNVWFCQAPTDKPIVGVAKLAPNGNVLYYGEEHGLSNRILVLKEGPGGTLYAAGIGNDSYLYRYHESSDTFINLSVSLPFDNPRFEVHDLTVDTTGVIWLGTTNGLLQFDGDRIERVPLGEYDNDEVRAVAVATDGSIWVATDTHGLLRWHDGDLVVFDEASGLPTKITTYRTLTIDEQQRIWIGTSEGLVSSHESNPEPGTTPRPILVEMAKNEKPLIPNGQRKFSSTDVLSFRFISLSYSGEEVVYQTRLVNRWSGETNDWHDLGSNTGRALTPLPNGAYTFQVRARQLGGYYWSEPTGYSFEITKAWYLTWWAYACYGLGALGTIWGMIRWSTRKLRREKMRLERLVQANSSGKSKADYQEDLQVIDQVIYSLGKSSSWAERLTQMFSQLQKRYPVEGVSLGVYSGFSDQLEVREVWLENGKITNRITAIADSNHMAWQCVTKMEELHLNSPEEIEEADGSDMNTELYLPLAIESEPRGFIGFKSHQHRAFDQTTVMSFRILANLLALTIKN